MGRLVESLAGDTAARSPGSSIRPPAPTASIPIAGGARKSRSIFRRRTASWPTCRRWRDAASTSCSARPDGPSMKQRCARRSPTPVSASSPRRISRQASCCSNLIVSHAARLFAAQPEFGAFLHEAHHSAKKDAPSGTALKLARAMRDAGFVRPIDVSSTRAGFDPRHAHGRFRRPGRDDHADAHPRDRSAFARGALTAAKWIRGRRGWFSMTEVLDSNLD